MDILRASKIRASKRATDKMREILRMRCGKIQNDGTRLTATNSRQAWTGAQDKIVLGALKTDAQIGKAIGRSMRAVQTRRSRLIGSKSKI